MSDSSSVGSVHLTLGVDDSQLLKQMTAAAAAAATAMQSKLSTAMNLRPAIDFSVATKGIEDAMKQSTTTIVGSVESLGEVIKGLVAESISTGAQAGANRMADVKMPSLKLDADKGFYETQLRALEQGLDNTNAKIHVQIQSIEEMKRAYAGITAKGQGETPAGLKASAEILRAEENLIKMQAVSDQTVLKIKAVEDAIANLGTNGASATSGLTQAVEQAQQAASASIDQALDKTKAWEASTKQAFDTMKRESKEASKAVSDSANPALKKMQAELDKNNAKLKEMGKSATSAKGGVEGLAGSASKVTAGLGRLGKAGLALMGVRTVFAAIRRVVASATESIRLMANQNIGLANTMNSLTQATDTMKGAFAAAVAPIIQALAPALQWLAEMATRAFNAIARLFAALTGKKSVMQAVGSTKQFTKATEKAVKTSTAGAKKTEKAWKRVLAPFDEITVLAGKAGDAADGIGSPGGGGIGGLGDVGPIFEEVDISGLSGKIQAVKDRLAEMWESFKKTEIAQKLGTALGKAFGHVSTKAQEAAAKVKEAFSTEMPRIIGAIFRLGPKIVEAWANVWSYLYIPNIAGLIGAAFDVTGTIIAVLMRVVADVAVLIAAIFSPIYDSINDFFNAHGEALSDLIYATWEMIGSGLSIIIQGIADIIHDIFTGLTEWFNEHGQEVKDLFTNTWETIWGILEPLWNGLVSTGTAIFTALKEFFAEVSPYITDAIVSAWDAIWNFIKPLWEFILALARTIFGALQTFWAQWGENIKGYFSSLWSAITTLIKGALEIISGVFKIFSALFQGDWEGALEGVKNVATTIWNTIWSTWQHILDAIGNLMSIFGDNVFAVWEGIRSVFENILQFIKNVFTGNWKAAWQNVVNIFTTIFDGLKNAVKIPINWIIDKLNSFLGGLNKIKIPDWVPGVGGKGFNIPNIPRLATGGVVDSPTVAMVGERGKEAVMPLENNTGWIRELAREIAAEIGGGGGDGELTANIYLGDEILDRVIAKLERKARQRNKPILT